MTQASPPAATVRTWRGAAAATLIAGEYEAIVLPELGMLLASLRHRGAEYVALPGGLAAYRAGHTTGVPLLHPWANRLSGRRYSVDGVEVDLRGAALHSDGNGLPIHGTMTARRGWHVARLGAGARVARLTACFGFDAHPELLASFPFPHELTVALVLGSGGLRVTTSVRPTGPVAVPISFGWHPYLRVPGARRDEWEVALPECAHARLDRRGIPTGRARAQAPSRSVLAGRELDDLFALGVDRVFTMTSRRRSLTVSFDDGYPFAQVCAPAGEPFCCIEPMTAATNALVTGDHPTVRPGATFAATFALSVSCQPG